MVDQKWIQSTAARVVARYASYAKHTNCPLEAWPGQPCELEAGHTPPCVAPSAFKGSRYRFDGMIPSSRPNQPPYHVTLAIDSDDATCTCVAYTRYNRNADCSHIKLIREAYRV